jgi:hypothetical protein
MTGDAFTSASQIKLGELFEVGGLMTRQVVLACSSDVEAIGLSSILKQALRCRHVALACDYAELHEVISALTAMAVM